jgi:NAD(P)-dependent dehydrogenase (short-subunit alcohol dehydrogenase family)
MAEDLKLEGRCAVITGAAGGIGGELARQAARRGMSVALADLDGARLEAIAEELRGQGVKVLSRVVDVRDYASVAPFAEEVLKTFPSIGATFANAGLLRPSPAVRPDLDTWNLTIDVNLKGVVHMAKAFAGPMVDRGEPAQFVITGSQVSFIVGPTLSSYCATKHALWAYADIMRMELAMEGSPVGVSLICPPRTRSGLTAETRARVVAADGEEAAKHYDTLCMEPSQLAADAFEKVAKREFWILAATDHGPMFRPRVQYLLDVASN